MSESAPDLHMLNVIVGDMSASLDFYRRLGVAVPAGEERIIELLKSDLDARERDTE